jgi:hypothetical protein
LNRWYTENCVDGVPGDLALGSIANEAFRVCESDVRRGGPVAVVVGNDLDTAMAPDSDARVGGAEVDSDYETLCFFGHRNLRMQLALTERIVVKDFTVRTKRKSRKWVSMVSQILYIINKHLLYI